MSHLTASRYRDLCRMIGDALDHPQPAIQEVGSRINWQAVVYMLGHRHPVTGTLIVDYVGSTIRTRSDASLRIREHLRNAEKRDHFTCQVVLPLRLEVPLEEVRRFEGMVARALGVPRWCHRVPGGQSPAN